AELFAPFGSYTPAGVFAVTITLCVPVVPAATVPCTVYVTDPSDGIVSESAGGNTEPDAEFPLAPPAAVLVYVTPVKSGLKVAASVTPVAVSGPAFDTTTVYVSWLPGEVLDTLSVTDTDRSA